MNQDQIEQYVAGKLGKDEAEAFEAYCVANPEFAKQVEFEQRLRDGIREVAAGSTAEFVRANNPMRWRVALAASLILAVAGGLFFWQRMLAGLGIPAVLSYMIWKTAKLGANHRGLYGSNVAHRGCRLDA